MVKNKQTIKDSQSKTRDIGTKAKPPKKICQDTRCPWHSSFGVRGKVFIGNIVSDKVPKTVVVEWGHHRFIQKYERYEKRRTRVVAHNPECISAKLGERVKIAECRPLSKTKSFVVIEKLEE